MSFFSQLRNAILGDDGQLSKSELVSAIALIGFAILLGLACHRYATGQDLGQIETLLLVASGVSLGTKGLQLLDRRK